MLDETLLASVFLEDDSHIFGGNFGDLLDGQKEAERFGVVSEGKGNRA